MNGTDNDVVQLLWHTEADSNFEYTNYVLFCIYCFWVQKSTRVCISIAAYIYICSKNIKLQHYIGYTRKLEHGSNFTCAFDLFRSGKLKALAKFMKPCSFSAYPICNVVNSIFYYIYIFINMQHWKYTPKTTSELKNN